MTWATAARYPRSRMRSTIMHIRSTRPRSSTEEHTMTFVIGAACVDVLDKACIEECPVDCIAIGDRMAYIDPDQCIDCSGCEPVCPVEAIYHEADLPSGQEHFIAENARYFAERR